MFNAQIRKKSKINTIKVIGLLISMESNFIVTCPVCGYTFRNRDSFAKKRNVICPMCGFKFKEPSFFPKRINGSSV